MKTVETLCLAATVMLGLLRLPVNAQVPTNFPGITVTTLDTNKVADGYVFLAVASVTPGIGSYFMMLDNDGTPVWYKENTNTHEIYDFKVQPNGLMTCAPFIKEHDWTGGGDVVHEIWDENHVLRETVTGGNGYVADGHDFQLLPNGHILQFGYYMTEVDMSQLVEGGYPAAQVSGVVIQELDAQRNVVWQWRSWDHYPFKDVASTRAVIDGFHLNDIFLDIDRNLVVGTPTQILKINRQTGEVMWTLGGDDNEFSLVGTNGDLTDFGGHGTYRLSSGNFLMYDNGNRQSTVSSSVHEYTLDEVNLTAAHVWTWQPTNVIGGWHRGNAQRLPNGNTFIGWGGASSDRHIPACTEVTPDGEKVFELYFDDMAPEAQVESYRAFRFPYPPAVQAVGDQELELAAGNEYEFANAGVTIDINSFTGDNYNEVTVTNEPYAPVYPFFLTSKAPLVLPKRVIVRQDGFTSIAADIVFDALKFGFQNPANLTVYHRPTPGTGTFVALPTTYNPVTKELKASMTQFGEFIFGYPDVADIAFPPILDRPENYRGVQTCRVVAPPKAESNVVYTVNQDLPILLSWSPKGFARYYELQVATAPDFASPAVNLQYRTEAFYVWSNALPATTYYWRVRTMISDFSTGDWSTNSFQTVPPQIAVTVPNGGEVWQRGLDYLIRWNDNIAEDVVIDLYKAGAWVQTIATNESSGAYEWEAGLALAPGTDYSIKIRSSANSALFDFSDNTFSIIDAPVINAGSLTRLPDGQVRLGLTVPGAVHATVLGSTNLSVWDELQTVPLTNGSAVFTDDTATNLPSRFYRLRVP